MWNAICSGPDISTTLLNAFWKMIHCLNALSNENGRLVNLRWNDLCLSSDSPSMHKYKVFFHQFSLNVHEALSTALLMSLFDFNSIPDRHNNSIIAIPYPSVLISSLNDTGGIMNAVAFAELGFHSCTTLFWNFE